MGILISHEIRIPLHQPVEWKVVFFFFVAQIHNIGSFGFAKETKRHMGFTQISGILLEGGN